MNRFLHLAVIFTAGICAMELLRLAFNLSAPIRMFLGCPVGFAVGYGGSWLLDTLGLIES